MAIERRLTEIVGRSAASSTPRARATTRWPPTWRCSCAPTPREARERIDRLAAHAGRRGRAPPRLADARLHPSAARPAGVSEPPPAGLRRGCWSATGSASRRSSRRPRKLPLGAGALAGVNFDTDRRAVAAELGFSAVAENSIDAVSNRDFVLDYLAAAATCATHLSRLGAEIVLWSSEEFGFCEVSDAWASGSSIMPQKKNPDAAELLRAKAPRVVADLVALHGVMHGLPLTYNKDMQEDKERLFDACDTLELCLDAASGMLESITFQPRPARRRGRGRVPRRHRRRRPARPRGACRSARPTGSSPAWSAARSSTASRCRS